MSSRNETKSLGKYITYKYAYRYASSHFKFNNSYNKIIIHIIYILQIRLKCVVHYELNIYRLSYITSCRYMYMVVSVITIVVYMQ